MREFRAPHFLIKAIPLAAMYHSSPDEVERKLAAYTVPPGYVDAVEGAIGPLQPALAQAPTGFARL